MSRDLGCIRKIFYPVTDAFFKWMMSATAAIMILTYIPVLFEANDPSAMLIIGIIVGAVLSLLAWIWFGTYYYLENDLLVCKAAFITVRVPLGAIKRITDKHSSFNTPAVWKFVKSKKGLTIEYKKEHDPELRWVMINPVKRDECLKVISERNENVVWGLSEKE